MNRLISIIVFLLLLGCQGIAGNDKNGHEKIFEDTSEDTSQFNIKNSTDIENSKSEQEEVIVSVKKAIENNKLGVTRDDNFVTALNPKGEGIFVYLEETEFYGVKRYCIWLVIDSVAYPLNSPSKMIIPSLMWPREVEDKVWEKMGLNKYMPANEAISILKLK